MQDKRYFVPSLARGLEILSSFSEEEPALGLSDLAQRLGLGRSSVYRLVYTLSQLGYLEFDTQTKQYTPSAKVLTLAANAIAGTTLSTAALPHLKDLARRFDETASLGVLVGHQVIFVQRIESHHILTTRFQVGSRLPTYCSSLGKTILAYLSPEEIRNILTTIDLSPIGPNTITDVDKLLHDLAQIRERGFGFNDEELTAGLHSVAAPIRSDKGEVIAAVDVSTLIARIPRQRLITEVAQAVMETANRISEALGAPPLDKC
jgi:PcaR/PcaU/PobR family beta-ketoadipate pathway transcriptional regulator